MTNDTLKGIRRMAREIHKGMKRGGPQGSKRGARGFTRKPKHPKREKENER